jgi:ComF family protein
MELINKLLGVIMQPTCIFCEQPGKYICKLCEQIYFEPYHERDIPEDVLIGFRYNKAIEYAVEQAKNEGFYLIAEALGELLAKRLLNSKHKDLITNPNNIIVPIPLHPDKEAARGYNQIDHLWKGMRRGLQINSLPSAQYLKLLKRVRNTKTQVGMNKAKRQENLKEAFIIDERVLDRCAITADTKIILLDDVYTTGSTVEQCTKALSQLPSPGVSLVLAKA